MLMTLDFSAKNVLVVGGTSGIGNGIAQAFRDAGANVYIWGTRASIDDYGDDDQCDFSGMHFSQVDVSNPNNIRNYNPPFQTLDVLVLSQGIVLNEAEYEMDKFSSVLNLNITSVMACCLRFRSLLTASSGNVIMLSSMGCKLSIPSAPAYCASKHAITGLCQSLALAWANDGIRVNAIAPGIVPSRMAKVITENPDYYQAIVNKSPIGRLGTVEEISAPTLFLASPWASYITGHTLIADGGHTLNDIVNHN